MKRKFLSFAQGQTKRNIGHAHACHKEGGDGGGTGGGAGEGTDDDDDDDEDDAPADETPDQLQKRLLDKIEKRTMKIIKREKLQNATEIAALIKEGTKDLLPEALRKFDAVKLQNSVRNISGELQKIKTNAELAAKQGSQKRDYLREMFNDEKVLERIERCMRSKGEMNDVVLNIRALTNPIATGTVTDNTVIADNPDFIESFSIDRFVKKRRPNEYIWDIVSRKTVPEITEYKIWLEEGDEFGAFAIVAEGAVKPLVSKTLVRNESKYKKVAGKRVYTEEFAKFRKEAYAIIEDLFNDQLMRNYAALLVTSLLAKAASYTGGILDGKYEDPTDYHAIGAVAAQIEALDFQPDLLLINPQDKWRIALEQDKQGRFFLNIPIYNTSTGEINMMGFLTKTSNRVNVGNFILGESKLFKVEDEPVKIRLGYGINVTKDGANVTDVTSDVDTNRFRIIAETFFHAYIPTNFLGSFVYGNFADIKTALTLAV